MSANELQKHCNDAILKLQILLTEFSNSGIEKMTKRAMLISYWVKTYVRYIHNEDKFSPESVFRLKRGAIVQVEFGYRVGRELGGRHYAVVIDRNNSMHRNTVTVVPLGSIKENTTDDERNAILEDGVYESINKKLNALITDARRTLQESVEMTTAIESAAVDDRAALKAVQRQKNESAEKLIKQATEWLKEISHLQAGSVAKVDQITTISKMRISQPLQKTHPLYGIRLSNRDLEKIDERLKNLYFAKE